MPVLWCLACSHFSVDGIVDSFSLRFKYLWSDTTDGSKRQRNCMARTSKRKKYTRNVKTHQQKKKQPKPEIGGEEKKSRRNNKKIFLFFLIKNKFSDFIFLFRSIGVFSLFRLYRAAWNISALGLSSGALINSHSRSNLFILQLALLFLLLCAFVYCIPLYLCSVIFIFSLHQLASVCTPGVDTTFSFGAPIRFGRLPKLKMRAMRR